MVYLFIQPPFMSKVNTWLPAAPLPLSTKMLPCLLLSGLQQRKESRAWSSTLNPQSENCQRTEEEWLESLGLGLGRWPWPEKRAEGMGNVESSLTRLCPRFPSMCCTEHLYTILIDSPWINRVSWSFMLGKCCIKQGYTGFFTQDLRSTLKVLNYCIISAQSSMQCARYPDLAIPSWSTLFMEHLAR